jgi:hypothetical protein
MTAPFPINTNVPNAPNNPANDVTPMKTNFANIDGYLKVDHVAPGSSGGSGTSGYHKIIHQFTQTSDPANIIGTNQVYSKNVTVLSSTDTQLFNMTGKGGISQMTGNSAGNNGWVWCAGLLIQWGFITLPGTSNPTGNVNFGASPNIVFPKNCFNVMVTLNANSSTSSANTCYTIGTPTVSGFQWGFTGSTSYNYIYWVAIGQ